MSDSQKKQYIILGCLAAAMLVVVVFQFMGGGKSRPQKRTQTRETAKVSERSSGRALPTESVAELAAILPGTLGRQPRDPFAVQVVKPQAHPEKVNGTGNSKPSDITSNGFEVPPVTFTLPEPGGQSAPPDIIPVDTTPQLRLTGIIEGEVRVAIIRGEDNKRYIVREGQSIDGMYAVESISRVGVRLRSYADKRIFVLQLGGSDASHGARA